MSPSRPLQAGDSAPEFALPAINRDGTVSLSALRAKGPVLLALMRGLHCPFCRRQIASLAATRDKLAREGVETLAVVVTPMQRARQYFQYRPTPVVLASDPEVTTHRAFGLLETAMLPDDANPSDVHWPQTVTLQQLMNTSVQSDELPAPMNLMAAAQVLNTRDGYEMTEADQQTFATHGMQWAGQFLIDTSGTIRWAYVEAPDSPDQYGHVPNDDEILAAARAACH
jgi:peroxiredoxin